MERALADHSPARHNPWRDGLQQAQSPRVPVVLALAPALPPVEPEQGWQGKLLLEPPRRAVVEPQAQPECWPRELEALPAKPVRLAQ